LRFMTGTEARVMEPELRCHAALFSASTAVMDSHLYMAALEADVMENGVDFVYGSSFVSATHDRTSVKPLFHVNLESSSGTSETITCSSIINCSGLYAPIVARAIHTGISSHDDAIPPAYYCKGNYFKMEAVKNPFERLIYPLPEAHGLGVHLTIDVGGNARFGPDVEWIEKLDSSSFVVNPKRADSFYAAIRTYWPGLPDKCLVPDYAGIRPKLGPAHVPAFDFILLDPSHHKVPGLVHCLGIESPGLTSSWAIANHVAKLVNAWS
jgi:L-2-hydroxyglutarate oxidase LhgO